MFDIGLGKPLVIFIIALFLIGPEKLPATAHAIGVLFRRMRAGWVNLQSDIERELSVEQLKADIALQTGQVANSLTAIPCPAPVVIETVKQHEDPRSGHGLAQS